MEPTRKPDAAEERVPPALHGKMPLWLFLMWVAFLLWGAFYLAKYALPDLKVWSGKPLPTHYERPI